MCPMGALKYLIQPLDPYWGSKPRGPLFGPPVTDARAPPLCVRYQSSPADLQHVRIRIWRAARRKVNDYKHSAGRPVARESQHVHVVNVAE